MILYFAKANKTTSISEISFRTYAFFYIIGLVLEYPKTLFKFKVYAGAVSVALSSGTIMTNTTTVDHETTNDEGDTSFIEKLTVEAGFTTWELASFLLTVGLSDLYINYVHLRALLGCFKRRGRLISQDSFDKDLASVHVEEAVA